MQTWAKWKDIQNFWFFIVFFVSASFFFIDVSFCVNVFFYSLQFVSVWLYVQEVLSIYIWPVLWKDKTSLGRTVLAAFVAIPLSFSLIMVKGKFIKYLLIFGVPPCPYQGSEVIFLRVPRQKVITIHLPRVYTLYGWCTYVLDFGGHPPWQAMQNLKKEKKEKKYIIQW